MRIMGCDFSKDMRFHLSLNNFVSSKLLLSETASHSFPEKVCHAPRHLLKAALQLRTFFAVTLTSSSYVGFTCTGISVMKDFFYDAHSSVTLFSFLKS